MEGVLGPREGGKFIADNAKSVEINQSGVNRLTDLIYEKVKSNDFNVGMWRKHDLNPQTMDEDAVNWVFVSAVLNFSFWSENDNEKYMVKYNGEEHTGYWSLCAAMNRALDEGVEITSASFYSSVDLETVKTIFRSDSNFHIPMIEERHRVLNEAGKVLMKKYQGSFANVIKKAEKSAQNLLSLIVNDFPSFQDIHEFSGKKIGLYKRAQILVGDIWGCCEGKGLGEFYDIQTITMFADYRIPQALVYFDALAYSGPLKEKLEKGYLFQSGDYDEVAIRGCSLWCLELVREAVEKRLKKDRSQADNQEDEDTGLVNAILIDYYIWDLRRDMAEEMKHIPFHRCRGIFY